MILPAMQKFIKDKYEVNYKFKQPILSETKEYELLNSIKIEKCRLCDSTNIIKRDFNDNKVQKYNCKNCKNHFTPTTSTIFEDHKTSISEWIEFLLDLFNYGSTSLTSEVNKNRMNTSKYWLQKTFLVLQDYQSNIILESIVYIDEFFYKVIKDGKQLRGLSTNQFCIGI